MKNIEKMSGTELLMARIFKTIPANAIAKEQHRRAESRPLITKAIAQRTMTRLIGTAA